MTTGLMVAMLLRNSQTGEFVRNSDYWVLPQIVGLHKVGVGLTIGIFEQHPRWSFDNIASV